VKRSISITVAMTAWLVAVGCASETEEEKKPAEEITTTPSTPVLAEDFCAELAEIACDAETDCCAASEPSSLGDGGGWPGQDSGSGDEASTCVTTQIASCRGSIGDLVTDPRTGYSADAGGKFVQKMREASESCWKKPIAYADAISVFRGTGELGANCTPEDGSKGALRASALSCKSGSSCRLYLKADGSALGVCEARADESCSHAFDCAGGKYCDLPAQWKPGVWGECHPLRTEGWSCKSDLECQSQHCDAAGACAPTNERLYCLTTPYANEVKVDEPLLYLRLGEASGGTASDASGNGNSATRAGEPGSVNPGALTEDEDSATSFDGVDDLLSLDAGAIGSQTSFSIELWMSVPEGTVSKPLVAFAEGPVLSIDVDGALEVNFADTDGDSHVLSAKEAKPAPNEWQHVVVTYDGLFATLYLNGKIVGEMEEAFVPKTSGEVSVGSLAGNYFAGAIDEVAIYGVALEKGRALQHHAIGKQGPDRPWPLYHWFE
jgi:hypothetical protein